MQARRATQENDRMRYFDIAEMRVDEESARTLGFKKVFNIGGDIGKFPGSDGKSIAFMSGKESFARAARSPNVLAIVADALPVQKKDLELMRAEGKLLILPAWPLMEMAGMQLVKGTAQLRNAFRIAKQMRVKSSVATMAKASEHLLSSMQLIETACMLCGSEEEAKEMVQRLGVFE